MRILLAYAHTESGRGYGAVGNGLKESIESREMTNDLADLLEKKHDVQVIGIKKSNDYLEELVAYANKRNFDLLVQIHMNSFNDPDANGSEVYYYKGNKEGKEYADSVAKELGRYFKNRGSKDTYVSDFVQHTKDTAILIETCFISNRNDVDKYKKEYNNIIKAMYKGITGETYNPPIQAESFKCPHCKKTIKISK